MWQEWRSEAKARCSRSHRQQQWRPHELLLMHHC